MTAFRFSGRKQKYNAKRTPDGFPSKLESAVYGRLIFRERQGEIKDIKRYPSVELQPGPPKVRICWKIDFSFVEVKSGETVYCEAKGVEDLGFKLKLRMFIAKKIGRLEIWKGNYKRPFLSRIIDPREAA